MGQCPADSGVGDITTLKQPGKLCEAYKFIQPVLNFVGEIPAAVGKGLVPAFSAGPESGVKGRREIILPKQCLMFPSVA